MIINKMENGIWTSIDTERNEVLCTIESLGNHIYKATNSFLKITAEVFPIDEYRTYAISNDDFKRLISERIWAFFVG